MSKEQEVAVIHPEGERELVVVGGPNQGSTVDTYGGSIHVKWDETAAVTPFGQLAFFIEFLSNCTGRHHPDATHRTLLFPGK